MPFGLVWVGGLVVLAAFLGEAATEGWSALHVERTLGGRASEGAMGPALLGFGMAVGRLGAHWFGSDWPPIRVMIIGSCVAGLGAGICWSCADYWDVLSWICNWWLGCICCWAVSP